MIYFNQAEEDDGEGTTLAIEFTQLGIDSKFPDFVTEILRQQPLDENYIVFSDLSWMNKKGYISLPPSYSRIKMLSYLEAIEVQWDVLQTTQDT